MSIHRHFLHTEPFTQGSLCTEQLVSRNFYIQKCYIQYIQKCIEIII